jgi:ornithine carbamoyltransferase
MKNLLSISDLSKDDVLGILNLARGIKNGKQFQFPGMTCAYDFEGKSLRTRATFLKALADLRITAIELPGLLQTCEEKRHLAGYMDQWLDLYVVRQHDHQAMSEFASYSRRPFINAMSDYAHPCEVLADAFSLQERFGDLQHIKVCIVGPNTNVLRSWQEFCELFGMESVQVMPATLHEGSAKKVVPTLREGLREAQVILTDQWPKDIFNPKYRVTLDALKVADPEAWVIPCPPFDTKSEIDEDVIVSKYFAGYQQKSGLHAVHAAIIIHLLSKDDQG